MIQVEEFKNLANEKYPDNGEPGHDYFAMLLRRAFVEGTYAMGERVFGDQELSVIGLTKIGTFNIPADPLKEGVGCKDVELWQREIPQKATEQTDEKAH